MPELLGIVGQEHAIAQLQQSMGGKRRAHAFIFAGPQGVGRRTTALAMARTLLCERPVKEPNANLAGKRFEELPEELELRQACGTCPECRTAQAGSHPDLHMIYKELAAYHDDSQVRERVMQELGIPVIKQFLIDAAGKRAARGRGKVFVVLEADLMSDAAQNALLKTLEEPPPGVTIILVAEQPEQLLPTTLSRCQLVRFGLLPREFVVGRLQEQETPSQEAAFWAAFTGGSIGRSMKLRDRGMYAVKSEMIERLAAMNRAGDAELGDQLHKKTESLAEDLIKATRTEHTEMSKNLAVRQTAGVMLELIAAAYRDAITVTLRTPSVSAGSAGSSISGGSSAKQVLPTPHSRSGLVLEGRSLTYADQKAAVAAIAAKFDIVQLASVIEQLSQLEQLLWRNVNPKTIWENVVITCASAAPLRAE